MKRTTIVLAALMMLVGGEARGQKLKGLATPTLLMCESTIERERKMYDWFVNIQNLTSGGRITLTQNFETGENVTTYKIFFIDAEKILAAEQPVEGKPIDVKSRLTINRTTGRMWQGHLVPLKETEKLWNGGKQQIGGFEKDTWFGANWDCKSTKKVL